jgi:micrococcal nuclease
MKNFLMSHLLALLYLVGLTSICHTAAATPAARTSATVLYVTDGDTIKVKIAGRKESVRLIGIDSPESKLNDRAYKQAYRSSMDVETIVQIGQQSKKYLSKLIPVGSVVTLEQDIEPRDRYGRILAYVYLPDGAMANEQMLEMGYASLLTIPPNVKYNTRFTNAAKRGREANRGLWGSGSFLNGTVVEKRKP